MQTCYERLRVLQNDIRANLRFWADDTLEDISRIVGQIHDDISHERDKRR